MGNGTRLVFCLLIPMAADRRPAAGFRRGSLGCVGAVVLAVAGWLADPRPGWAQSGENRSFALDIHNARVATDKQTIRVTEGDLVELRWTTDEAVELHLHGYDIRLDLYPGAPGTMTLEAHTAGRFPVGIHGTGGKGHGNTVYLEVLPR